MSTTTSMTAEELLRLPKDGYRYELIRGELHRMSPAGHEHCEISSIISTHLRNFVIPHKLGTVLTNDPGYKLESNPDTVRAPDVAFISCARIKQITDRRVFQNFAPDLAIEVLSPGDSLPKLVKKCEVWLNAGTLAAVIVNPRRKTATLYESNVESRVFTDAESLTVPDVVPGWEMPVREMFELELG